MDELPATFTSVSHERAGIIFYQALRLPADQRPAFLDAECAEDAQLRIEVDELLGDHEKAGNFLDGAATHFDAQEGSGRFYREVAGNRIGSYKLMEKLGEGGFGVVWVAEQDAPVCRLVAMKILKAGMDTSEVIARFGQERQALAMMDHPNIARVFDAGSTPQGRPYFVMELVRGIKLTTYCDEANLPTAERLRLFIAVCRAVQHAHQKGIIHRDLKPSNILVTLHDGVPVPKVIDFGIAKTTQRQRLTDLTIYTQFEQMLGTPLYMSPEQAEMSGLDIDTRSDIYSLGVLLYELLTGRTPFDPASLMKCGLDEIRRVVREQEPQKPSNFISTFDVDRRTTLARHRQTDGTRLVGQIRGDLDWIVMKALEKDRSRRYETADNFAQDLQRHLDSEPVQARPATQFYRFRRFAKRNKGVFAAGVGVSLALVGGAALSTWHSLRADREAKRANQEAARANQEAARANAALSELRASAPVFGSMARALATEGNYEEAIRKLDIAITLRPDLKDYVLAKADLLQSLLRFAEAATDYREAMRLDPGDKRAETNAGLSETLAAETASQSKLSRASLRELYNTMTNEQRPAAELIQVARTLGEENTLLMPYWLDRLKKLPIPPDRPLEQRLTADVTGHLTLDLSGTDILNLSLLTGMPLERLILSGCPKITDLGPLRGMPLRELTLGRMESDVLLAGNQRRQACQVSDLAPLQGMRLVSLDLEATNVTDLSALRGMPLEILNLNDTAISDLSPLQGMPLTSFDGVNLPAVDFSPLAGAPLAGLNLQGCAVEDLSFLKDMPTKVLLLNGCDRARGYRVLSSLKQLELLWLVRDYANLPPSDVAGIASLRHHPTLRQMSTDPRGASIAAPPAMEFWKSFGRDQKLRDEVSKMAEGDTRRLRKIGETWEVNLNGLPVRDLAPLRDAPISNLHLFSTQVSDLRPLIGMPLESLYVGSNRITSLEALEGIPLTKLFLSECPPGLDLLPLTKIGTLQSLVLPPEPQNLDALRGMPNLTHLSYIYAPDMDKAGEDIKQFWSNQKTEALAREGNFQEAANLIRGRLQPGGPASDWIMLGAFLLAQNDNPAYRKYCQEIRGQLAKDDVVTAAKVCLLGPNSGVPSSETDTLMQRVVSVKPHPGDAYFILLEGLHQYRAGKYKEAVELLLPMHQGDRFPAWSAAASAIISMAYHQDGKVLEARAEILRYQESPYPRWPQRPVKGRWHDWLIAHLLLQEAEQLIGASDRTSQ